MIKPGMLSLRCWERPLGLSFRAQRGIRLFRARMLRFARHDKRTRAAVIAGLALAALSPAPALAGAPASGFGAMTVSPNAATADDGEFGGDTMTFTFTNNTSLASTSAELTLAIPADWSDPNGSIAVSYPASS